MKKTTMLFVAISTGIMFSGCVTTSTPALYVKHMDTQRWYHIYQAKNCEPNEVKSYKTGAIQCYSKSKRKTNVIYPVTQQQRNIDSQHSMAQLNAQRQSMNNLSNQLNEMARTQAINNHAIANMGRPVYNIYGY